MVLRDMEKRAATEVSDMDQKLSAGLVFPCSPLGVYMIFYLLCKKRSPHVQAIT
jgi:hypothetical protein